MGDAAAFEFACEQLAAHASLDRLAARGTVRIVLKQAGLDARAVTPDQMAVVAEKLLPPELANRGVAEGPRICTDLARRVREMKETRVADSPEAVFARLAS